MVELTEEIKKVIPNTLFAELLNVRKDIIIETLEKVRKDFKNVELINVDKYIDGELEKLQSN